jgi:hypothetical protein
MKHIIFIREKVKIMSKKMRLLCQIHLAVFALVLMGCGGCGGVRKLPNTPLEKTTSSGFVDTIKKIVQQKASNNVDTATQRWYKENPQYAPITITRNVFGKEITFNIDPMHEGGEASKKVWIDSLKIKGSHKRYVLNHITQLSPSTLLYSEFPEDKINQFYFYSQPKEIEFLDQKNNTIKKVNIWDNHPYKYVDQNKLTYYHFDAEGMEMMDSTSEYYNKPITEYSLFTNVRTEGNHVIVKYQLRSLVGDLIKDFKSTLHIYDLIGNFKYEIKDYPSIGGAVVSNNGEYMMFTFGGGIRSANNPMPKIDRSGWALMRLRDQKVIYQEYTDDGILAFNRLWMDQGYLRVAYSTPSTLVDYDYWVFFDDKINKIFNYKITKEEREFLNSTAKIRIEKDRLKYYLSLFNFQQISITNQ